MSSPPYGWLADGTYWSPNSPANQTPGAGQTLKDTPLQQEVIPTGEFRLVVTWMTEIEAGSTGRFYCYFEHVQDGAISFTIAPNTTFPVVAILDGNGNPVYSPTNVQGVVIGTVTANQGAQGSFYSQVEFGASMQPGDYVVQWTATYTPDALQPSGPAQVALPIQVRRQFRVKKTAAPSKFFFKQTKHM